MPLGSCCGPIQFLQVFKPVLSAAMLELQHSGFRSATLMKEPFCTTSAADILMTAFTLGLAAAWRKFFVLLSLELQDMLRSHPHFGNLAAAIQRQLYIFLSQFCPVEVNPFQNLPGLYSVAKQKFYREQSAAAGLKCLHNLYSGRKAARLMPDRHFLLQYQSFHSAGNGEEANLPPHLFSVAAASYTAMLHDSKNQ